MTGSGKTILAQRLAEKTGLTYIAVDELTWEPGWIIVPFDVQRDVIRDICRKDDWILDGAYGHWLDIPLQRVDLIVALDYPRWLSLSRLVGRTLRRWIDQRPVCNGNRESLRVIFSRNSILLWHFRSFRRKRNRIRAWQREGQQMLTFRHPREAEAWLAGLEGPL